MRHKNTLFFTVLTSLALVFTMGAKGGCGVTGLNKSEVKGKAAEELPQADIDALDVFGTKKLKNIGGDVGGAVNEFKKAMRDGQEVDDKTAGTGNTIEGEVTKKTKQ